MNERVLEALRQHVPGSEGTVTYLKLCQKFDSSFNDPTLPPLVRVNRAWYCVLFLRGWREWILKNAPNEMSAFSTTLKDNFITTNAYACIEINAHYLIQLITKFRDENTPELFILILFSSQVCEQTFRQVRSMGTVNFTKINHTLLEVIHLFNRIHIQNDITYFKLANSNVNFPRIHKKVDKMYIGPLPSDDEIRNEIELVKNEAIQDLTSLGINIKSDFDFKCNLATINHANLENILPYNSEDESDSDDEYEILATDNDQTKSLNINRHTNANVENTHYLDVSDERGSKKTVRKSRLVWLLSETTERSSSDRFRRVQEPELQKTSRRHLKFQSISVLALDENIKLYESDQLCIGQWVCFSTNTNKFKCSFDKKNLLNNIVIGTVVGFKYVKADNRKKNRIFMGFL